MKKLYQTLKYIRILEKRSRKSLKRRKRRNRIIKNERRMLQGKSKFEAGILKQRQYKFDCRCKAPSNFSFLENTAQVISFIYDLERCLEKRKTVYVVLQNVKNIDYGGMTVLLSVMIKFKENKIKFNGDLPNDPEVRDTVVNSGFFDALNSRYENRTRYRIGRANQILTHAEKNVTASLGIPIMEEASNTIWGKRRLVKGFQRVLVELMQNTNNHAAKNQKGVKHWWLSVNHDAKNKTVSFVFMDHGVGIFSSLYNKPEDSKWYNCIEKLKEALKNDDSPPNNEILKMLLNGIMHATVTGKSFRGKGIPALKGVLDRNEISNLHVVTNNVFADIVHNDYRIISESFNGTFYYWELNVNNNNQEWTIK